MYTNAFSLSRLWAIPAIAVTCYNWGNRQKPTKQRCMCVLNGKNKYFRSYYVGTGFPSGGKSYAVKNTTSIPNHGACMCILLFYVNNTSTKQLDDSAPSERGRRMIYYGVPRVRSSTVYTVPPHNYFSSRAALQSSRSSWSSNRAAPIKSIFRSCLLYTSPSPRDKRQSRMPSSA